MAKKEKHHINWKGLLTIKGLIALALAAGLAWLLGSALNIIPDSIPYFGVVDNIVIAVILMVLGWKLTHWGYDFFEKAMRNLGGSKRR